MKCGELGLPRSIQEVMGSARPIITTDAPGCRESVIPGQNGALVPPRDVPARVAAMSSFIDHFQAIAQMGIALRRYAEDKFDIGKGNATMIQTIGL